MVGLAAEARIARILGATVAVGGGTAWGARHAAKSLLNGGASALISFGLAGGLDPQLSSGTIMIPSAVVVASGCFNTDPELSASLGGQTPHLLLGAEHPVTTAQQKQKLFATTSCAAVDLESGAVAELAAAHGVPFAVLRAICDPAGRTLPPAALIALDVRGMIAFGRVGSSLLKHPGQIPGLLVLTGDAARARRALLRRVRIISRPG